MNDALATATVTAPDNGEDLTFLPLDRIEVKPGFNSRIYFDPVKLAELAESIGAHGVVQPISVRAIPDREGYFWITVGERRWRAAGMAGLTQIPAVIRTVSESEALALNAIENRDRDDIGPAEEAILIRRMVEACDGDRIEAGKRLGFSPKVVEARLLLLNATPDVVDALNRRTIALGHAELLSTLPAETQNGTLTKVLADQVSVADLKKKLDAYTLALASAIFDTTDCRTCPHNSTTQSSLFAEHVGDGRCSDHACFGKKRDAALELKKAALRETYPVVYTDKERDPATHTLLVRSGSFGVGREQFEACRGCGSFGVLMSTRPGEEGRVTEDICFDLECHGQKVKAYQASIVPVAPVSSGDKASTPASSAPSTKSAPARKSSASAKSVPRGVTQLIHTQWRNTAAVAVAEHPRLALVYALYTLAKEAGNVADGVLKQHGLTPSHFRSGKLPAAITALAGMDGEKLKTVLVEVAAVYIRDSLENGYGKDVPVIVQAAKETLQQTRTDLAAHFTVNKDFLAAHTKSGLASLMAEAGFVAWYDEKHGKKSFDKLLAEKHDKIVKTILSAGFEFKGFVPKAMQVG